MIEDAKALCRGPDLDGDAPSEVREMPGVTNEAVNALIAARLLPMEGRLRPNERYLVQVIAWNAFQRFQVASVTLFDPAAAAGL